MRAELFIIEPGVYRAADADAVVATCDALRELDLFHLPYSSVTVRLPGREFLTFKNLQEQTEYKALDHIHADVTIHEPRMGSRGIPEVDAPKVVLCNEINDYHLDVTERLTVKNAAAELEWDADNQRMALDSATIADIRVRGFLIAMLAVRNVRKTTVVNKLAKLGIGRRKYQNRFTHVTTISLPRPEDMEDDHEHKPTGTAKAPHLRRGHIRHQHYGPKGSYIKKVWIAPVFVNADPDFVSKRTAYNVVRSNEERTDGDKLPDTGLHEAGRRTDSKGR